MQLDEDTVMHAVVSLRRRGFVRAMQPSGSRVTKYSHLLSDALGLDRRDLALLGVLMLRGPQTAGELHTRTTRLAEFADLAAVEATLASLIAREPESLVAVVPRRPGQKEVRYAHLLSGEPAVAEVVALADAPVPRVVLEDRVVTLERSLDELRRELTALRAELAAFREQFR
jgi:uncharacterized protein